MNYVTSIPMKIVLFALVLLSPLHYAHTSVPGSPGKAGRTQPATTLAGDASTVLLEEHFDAASDSTPPSGWTNRILAGPSVNKWRFDNPGNRTTAMQASAPFAGFDSDHFGPDAGPQDVALESPAFSVPLDANVTLTFRQYFRSNPAATSAVVEAFDGTTWSPVDSTVMSSTDGQAASIDITHEVAGVGSARIRFRFRGNYSWWWFVDDVVIKACSIAPRTRLLFENFSTAAGSTPPAGWTNNQIQGTPADYWRFDNPGDREFRLPLSRPCAIFDSDTLSRLSGPQNVALESPAFSPLANSTVRLKFNQFFRGDSGGRATVEVFNGTCWVQKWTSASSSPNPDTMCIDISGETAGIANARVRFRWTAWWAWWWIVDNVEVVQSPGSGLVSDDFNAPSLNTGIWQFINPLGDASCTMTGTQAAITVPAGVSHDIIESGNSAPRIMQSVNDPRYFELFVKCDALMNQPFQMQGIQVWQDSVNFLRLELYGNGGEITRLAWSFVNGVHQDVGTAGLGFVSAPLYMKIARQGDVWTQSWSTDGINYTPGTTFTRSMVASKIGLHAGNAGFPPSTSPAFTALFDYFKTSDPLPIRLASFTAVLLDGNSVRLDWRTISETNNYGFEVQKSENRSSGFQTLPNSFVPGHGTTLEPHNYSWIDRQTGAGTWFYRLKQSDLDGTVTYTDPVQVTIATGVEEQAPREFALQQNYPNPFNPSTDIRFTVESTQRTSLEVYNPLGQRVATLFDDVAEAGRYYTVKYNAGNLASGVYFYRLQSGTKTAMKKLMLLK